MPKGSNATSFIGYSLGFDKKTLVRFHTFSYSSRQLTYGKFIVGSSSETDGNVLETDALRLQLKSGNLNLDLVSLE